MSEFAETTLGGRLSCIVGQLLHKCSNNNAWLQANTWCKRAIDIIDLGSDLGQLTCEIVILITVVRVLQILCMELRTSKAVKDETNHVCHFLKNTKAASPLKNLSCHILKSKWFEL